MESFSKWPEREFFIVKVTAFLFRNAAVIMTIVGIIRIPSFPSLTESPAIFCTNSAIEYCADEGLKAMIPANFCNRHDQWRLLCADEGLKITFLNGGRGKYILGTTIKV